MNEGAVCPFNELVTHDSEVARCVWVVLVFLAGDTSSPFNDEPIRARIDNYGDLLILLAHVHIAIVEFVHEVSDRHLVIVAETVLLAAKFLTQSLVLSPSLPSLELLDVRSKNLVVY